MWEVLSYVSCLAHLRMKALHDPERQAGLERRHDGGGEQHGARAGAARALARRRQRARAVAAPGRTSPFAHLSYIHGHTEQTNTPGNMRSIV